MWVGYFSNWTIVCRYIHTYRCVIRWIEKIDMCKDNIYTYIHIFIRMNSYTWIHPYVYIYTNSIYIYTYNICIYIYIYIYLFACLHACMLVYLSMWIRTYVYTQSYRMCVGVSWRISFVGYDDGIFESAVVQGPTPAWTRLFRVDRATWRASTGRSLNLKEIQWDSCCGSGNELMFGSSWPLIMHILRTSGELLFFSHELPWPLSNCSSRDSRICLS